MKKKMLSMLAVICLFTACNETMEDGPQGVSAEGNYREYCVSFDNIDFSALELNSDSLVIPVTCTQIGGQGVITKASGLIEKEGTITEEKGVKTIWRPNTGERLVPNVFTGSDFTRMTVSDSYKISFTINITDPNVMVRGFEGEYSGYSNANLHNDQLRHQYMTSNGNSFTFYTFAWHILSDINGKNYGLTNCYIPCAKESIRLYYRIYE